MPKNMQDYERYQQSKPLPLIWMKLWNTFLPPVIDLKVYWRNETKKSRRYLYFEQKYCKLFLPTRTNNTAKTEVIINIHSKIYEPDRNNVAVEASHKSELFAEQGMEQAPH